MGTGGLAVKNNVCEKAEVQSVHSKRLPTIALSHKGGRPLSPTFMFPDLLVSTRDSATTWESHKTFSFCLKLWCGNITSEDDFIIQEPPVDGQFCNQSSWDRTLERRSVSPENYRRDKDECAYLVTKDSACPVTTTATCVIA